MRGVNIETHYVEGLGLPKEIFFNFPNKIDLTVSKDEIIVSKLVIKTLKKQISNILKTSNKDKYKLINAMMSLIKILIKKDMENDLKVKLGSLERKLKNGTKKLAESENVILLPNIKGIDQLDIGEENVEYIDKDIYPVELIDRIPNVEKVDGFESRNGFEVYTSKFKDNIKERDGLLVFNKVVILDVKIYNKYKHSFITLDNLLNIKTTYENNVNEYNKGRFVKAIKSSFYEDRKIKHPNIFTNDFTENLMREIIEEARTYYISEASYNVLEMFTINELILQGEDARDKVKEKVMKYLKRCINLGMPPNAVLVPNFERMVVGDDIYEFIQYSNGRCGVLKNKLWVKNSLFYRSTMSDWIYVRNKIWYLARSIYGNLAVFVDCSYYIANGETLTRGSVKLSFVAPLLLKDSEIIVNNNELCLLYKNPDRAKSMFFRFYLPSVEYDLSRENANYVRREILLNLKDKDEAKRYVDFIMKYGDMGLKNSFFRTKIIHYGIVQFRENIVHYVSKGFLDLTVMRKYNNRSKAWCELYWRFYRVMNNNIKDKDSFDKFNRRWLIMLDESMETAKEFLDKIEINEWQDYFDLSREYDEHEIPIDVLAYVKYFEGKNILEDFDNSEDERIPYKEKKFSNLTVGKLSLLKRLNPDMSLVSTLDELVQYLKKFNLNKLNSRPQEEELKLVLRELKANPTAREMLQNSYDAIKDQKAKRKIVIKKKSKKLKNNKCAVVTIYRDFAGMSLSEFLNLWIVSNETGKANKKDLEGIFGTGALTALANGDEVEVKLKTHLIYLKKETDRQGNMKYFGIPKIREYDKKALESDTKEPFKGTEIRVIKYYKTRLKAELSALGFIANLKKYAGRLLHKKKVVIIYNDRIVTVKRHTIYRYKSKTLKTLLEIIVNYDGSGYIEQAYYMSEHRKKWFKYVPDLIAKELDLKNLIMYIGRILKLTRNRNEIRDEYKYLDNIAKFIAGGLMLLYIEKIMKEGRNIEGNSSDYYYSKATGGAGKIEKEILRDAYKISKENFLEVDFSRYVHKEQDLIKLLTKIKSLKTGKSMEDIRDELERNYSVELEDLHINLRQRLEKAGKRLKDNFNRMYNQRKEVNYLENKKLRILKRFLDDLFKETGIGFESNFFYYKDESKAADYYPILDNKGQIKWRVVWNTYHINFVASSLYSGNLDVFINFLFRSFLHEVTHTEELEFELKKTIKILRAARHDWYFDHNNASKLEKCELLLRKYFVSLFTHYGMKSYGDMDLLVKLYELLQEVDIKLLNSIKNRIEREDEEGRKSYNFGIEYTWSHQSDEKKDYSFKSKMTKVVVAFLRRSNVESEYFKEIVDRIKKEDNLKYKKLESQGLLKEYIKIVDNLLYSTFGKRKFYIDSVKYESLENAV